MLVSSALLWHGPVQGTADCEITCSNWMAVRATNLALFDSCFVSTCSQIHVTVDLRARSNSTGVQVLMLWVVGSGCFGVSAVAAFWQHAVLQL